MCERKSYLGIVLLPARELSATVGQSPMRRAPLFQLVVYTLFFYKNIFYKNIEAEICEILRIF